MEEFIAGMVVAFLGQYQDETMKVLTLAFLAAIVSAWLVEPIMMAIFNDKDKVSRWKPVAFFIMDFIFLLLVALPWLRESVNHTALFLAAVLLISAISAAIYYTLPAIIQKISKAAHQYAAGGKVDKAVNGKDDNGKT